MDINDMIKQIRHKYADKERDFLLKCYQVIASVKRQAHYHIDKLAGQPKAITKYKKYRQAVMDVLASVSK